jgi:Gluconate 2-dehydrogenase subunit 3
MQRRTALQQLAVLLGGITLTPQLMAETIARATTGDVPAHLLPQNLQLLAEMVDTILPDTDTPGAKAANVHNFIALVIEECVAPKDRPVFWAGLDKADADCKAMNGGKSFVDCTAAQRTAFFKKLEAESKGQSDPNFWRTLKGLTLFGYFTSEIGMTQALEYDPIPGQWVPDMKIDSNTKAWASMF